MLQPRSLLVQGNRSHVGDLRPANRVTDPVPRCPGLRGIREGGSRAPVSRRATAVLRTAAFACSLARHDEKRRAPGRELHPPDPAHRAGASLLGLGGVELVFTAGIAPTFQPSQGCVLSVGRREHGKRSPVPGRSSTSIIRSGGDVSDWATGTRRNRGWWRTCTPGRSRPVLASRQPRHAGPVHHP